MNPEPVLQVRGISYSYEEDKMVLDNVSTDIYAGEKIAVIGANGAGKSTFFLCLNGVVTPDTGELLYRGIRIGKKNLRTLRKNVGIVFQDADSQIIASTVSAEVSFGPMNLKLPREEVKSRVHMALDYMNLQDLKDRPPHYLSGGEKKRVTIADIIAMEPEIFIFDEPATALDPLNQQVLEEVLDKLQQEGKTLLLSTHDVDFAYRFAGRILVFSEGRIIADGDPVDIFKNQSVLDRANLKRPALFKLYETMVQKGLLKCDSSYPRDVQDFSDLL